MRPATTAQLDADQRRGEEIASFNRSALPTDPAVIKAYAAFLEAALKGKLEIVDSGYRIAINTTLTDQQLESRLADAQSTWDHKKEQYDAELAPETSWARDSVLRWARHEGFELPGWAYSEEDATAAV